MAGALVVDSYGILRLLQGEEGYNSVTPLLRGVEPSGEWALMSAIDYGEIIYIVKRTFGDQKKIECRAAIERLGAETLSVPKELVFKAAEYKADFGISYGDCFALASAVEDKASLVTGDPEFRKVAMS